jgi:hypothetical protein
MKCFKTLALACVLAFVGTAGAATFNLFQPATGVLKGNSSTYVTTAAASSDIRALWSGTCNASSYLRGDGSCSVPAGTGVTSVGLTMPSGLSVSGSPVTSSGTLAVTTLLNGIVKGNGSGFTTAASSDVIGLWTGTCNSGTFLRADGSCQTVGGGTGTVTSVGLTMPTGFSVTGSPVTGSGTLAVTTSLSGVLKGNGSAFTTAASSDITGLWSGTCDATTYLRGDGACAAAGGGTAANPTGTIGLTAVNGSASTFLRSDGAPALSQSIAPTWTGTHTFNQNGGQIVVQNTSAAADQKNTMVRATSSGGFAISTSTDAAPTTAVNNVFSFSRSGTSLSTIAFGDTGQNPNFTFNGTGATTFAGTVAVSASGSSSIVSTGGNVTITANSSGAGIFLNANGLAGSGVAINQDASVGRNLTVSNNTTTNTLTVGAASHRVGVYGTYHGLIQDTGTVCTIASGSGGYTCARNSTGNLTVTFGTSYASTPTCVVSTIGAGRLAYTPVYSTTSMQALVTDTAGTPVASYVSFICAGS